MEDSPKKSFLKGISYLFLVKVFNIFISAIYIFITANYLGPADYGIFNYVFSIICLLPGIFGIYIFNSAITRYTSETKNKEVFKQLIKYEFYFLIPLFLFVLFGSELISKIVNKDITTPLRLFSIAIILVPLFESFKSFFLAFKKFKRFAFFEGFLKLLTFLITILFIYALSFKITGLIIAACLSYFITILLMIKLSRNVKETKKTIDKKRIKRYVKTGILASSIRRFSDVVFLWFFSLFLTSNQMGLYSLAEKGSLVIGLITASITSVLFPFLSEFSNDLKRIGKYCSGSIKFSMLISFLFLITALLIGKPFLTVFFPNYVEAYPLLLILIFRMIFGFSIFLELIFNTMERLDLLTIIYIIEPIFFLIIGYFLMSNFNVFGAVLTQVFVTLLISIICLFFVRRLSIKISFIPNKEDIVFFNKILLKIRNLVIKE